MKFDSLGSRLGKPSAPTDSLSMGRRTKVGFGGRRLHRAPHRAGVGTQAVAAAPKPAASGWSTSSPAAGAVSPLQLVDQVAVAGVHELSAPWSSRPGTLRDAHCGRLSGELVAGAPGGSNTLNPLGFREQREDRCRAAPVGDPGGAFPRTGLGS